MSTPTSTPSVCPTCGQSLIDERTRKRVLRAQASTQRAIERKVRAAITADIEAATRAQDADERERLRARVDQLQRQLDSRSAHDRGAAHERDVHGALTEAFPGDRVVRDGRRGDILHTVLDERGQEAGLILYECKNAGTWQSAWLTKLRSDGRKRQTPYLVLVTRKLPAKERGLCVREDVALCEPAHVAALASIIRRWAIAAHRSRSTARGAPRKAQRLYDYLAGDAFRADFAAVAACTRDLDAERSAERDQHERTWSRRAHVQEQLRTAHVRISATLEEELADDGQGLVEPIPHLANGELVRAALAS